MSRKHEIAFPVKGDFHFELRKREGTWEASIYEYGPTGEIFAAQATDKDKARAMGKAVLQLKLYLNERNQ